MSSNILNGIFAVCVILVILSLSVSYFIDNFTTRESAQYIRSISAVIGGLSICSIIMIDFYKPRKGVSAINTYEPIDDSVFDTNADLTTAYM